MNLRVRGAFIACHSVVLAARTHTSQEVRRVAPQSPCWSFTVRGIFFARFLMGRVREGQSAYRPPYRSPSAVLATHAHNAWRLSAAWQGAR